MAHFAQLEKAVSTVLVAENTYVSGHKVLQVIVVNNNDTIDENGNESEEVGIAFCQSLFGTETLWKQTSYNGNIRGIYAGVGHVYDPVTDMFVCPTTEEKIAAQKRTSGFADAIPVDESELP
jgi:hypothetical protein